MQRLRAVVVFIVAVGSVVLAAPSAAGASGSGWSKVPSPNPVAPTGQLLWVSCPGVSTCMAVGTYVDPSGAGVSLAERWDGTRWHQLPIPNPPGAAVSQLHGVSCTSSTACIAVGFYLESSGTSHALAERWDGTSWSIESIPEPPGSQDSHLSKVSCSSASRCTAVGNFTDSSGTDVTLAERWDGSSWAAQSTPNPTGAQFSQLSGVSCTSSTVCTAVGFSDLGTLAERWNGTAWSIQSSPSPGQSASLFAVSCTSSSACMAVGNYTDNSGTAVTLAERWNGTKWTVHSTPNPPGSQFAFLNSVSCSSASACTAVGFSFDGSGESPVAERWDGSTWSLQASPNLPAVSGGSLLGVACPGASVCVGVGYGSDESGTLVTRGQGWDGTQWSLQSTVNPDGARGAQLAGVDCTSPSSCTAVGQSTGGTLAERWDGTAWRITPTPNPAGAPGSGLGGVSCTSSSSCIAVGTAFDSSGNAVGTVTERWDGTTWSVQPTPTSASAGAFLNAVSCTSPNACTAVGNAASGGTLAERWDGTSWSIQPTPSPAGAQLTFFTGVSCTSPMACIAVGTAFSDSEGNNPTGTLTERWDGTSWSIQPTPTSASAGAFLYAVSCTSANTCTAVGNTASELLAERWDGTTWTVQSTPTPADMRGGFLSGVACSTPSACTAVGLGFTPSGQPFTLAERGNGSSWGVQNTPTLPGVGDMANPAVSCPVLSVCVAVGGYNNDGPNVTLAEQWNPDRGSAPVAGSSLQAASRSVRSCALLPATASCPADRMAPSPWLHGGYRANWPDAARVRRP